MKDPKIFKTHFFVGKTLFFAVKWLVNNIQFGYGGHEPVPANTTVMNGNSQFDYTFNSPGNHTVLFRVDSSDLIHEYNEIDNETTAIITVSN